MYFGADFSLSNKFKIVVELGGPPLPSPPEMAWTRTENVSTFFNPLPHIPCTKKISTGVHWGPSRALGLCRQRRTSQPQLNFKISPSRVSVPASRQCGLYVRHYFLFFSLFLSFWAFCKSPKKELLYGYKIYKHIRIPTKKILRMVIFSLFLWKPPEKW